MVPRTVKLLKFEVCVIDFEDVGADDMRYHFDNMRYVNTVVIDCSTAEIGEWSDDHELNQQSATPEQYRKYFKETK